MNNRRSSLIAMALGLIWSAVLLWGAATFVSLPVFALIPTIMTAFFAPGIVMLLMVGRLAQRRFNDDAPVDGRPADCDSPAGIDQRVLTNTVEQLALALCIWPAAAVLLAGAGPGAIMTLGLNFALMRVLFWLGCHLSLPLRAFGFAASFYPTVLVALWVLWALVS